MAEKPDKHSYPKEDYQIYTNGAFCEPIRFRRRNGEITWLWVVTEFIDDSFRNGRVVIPREEAETSEELIVPDEDDEE